jgi:hypothetical protein
MNYNDPLMMRRGGMTRRRRRRRGGVDTLLEQQRRQQREDARRRQQEALRRQQQRASAAPPPEQRRLPDNRAAMDQRMADIQATQDARGPLRTFDFIDENNNRVDDRDEQIKAENAAMNRFRKSTNMQEDLAGGPLAASPTPVTGGDQIRFGPGGQPMPQREPLQGPGGGGSRLGTGYEPRRGQPGYRPPSPQSQVRDQRDRYMPERRSPRQMPGSERDIRMRRTVEELKRIGDLKRGRRPEMPPSGPVPRGERPFPGGWHGGRVPGETLPGEPTELPLPQLPGQQPPMPDSVQQMLAEMGAQQERLEQAKQQYQEQPQLPDSVLQMLAEMGSQQERLDSFKQPDPLQQLMDDLEMRRRRAQYGDSMPRRAAGGGMINADPFAGYRARRR